MILLVIIGLIICAGGTSVGWKALPTARVGRRDANRYPHGAGGRVTQPSRLRVCGPQRSFLHQRKCHRADRFSRAAAGDERRAIGGCGARDRHPRVDDVSRDHVREGASFNQLPRLVSKIDCPTGKDTHAIGRKLDVVSSWCIHSRGPASISSISEKSVVRSGVTRKNLRPLRNDRNDVRFVLTRRIQCLRDSIAVSRAR